MTSLSLKAPWLEFDLGDDMQVLSWAVHRPGLVRARRILWREVRNADLPPELDVEAWLEAELRARRAEDAVTLLTSRAIETFTCRDVTVGQTQVLAVATVGLSNAERVGLRMDRSAQDWGTINVALRVSDALSDAALLEAMSVAVEARTAAVLDLALSLSVGSATGTGTDCIAIAAQSGTVRHTGKHTEIGEAIGQAVYGAVRDGAGRWVASMRETTNATT
ncbi:MAG: adenosylcobinamide amidohydrolase [Pseudomonadota bacterium]